MTPRARAIVHLDADAFFAAVEQASDPRLRGRPIAVGGESRGIIASASYEARAFGVHTPMPTVRARKLCPQLIVLPGDFERYEQFSNWMFGYAHDFTPDVEQTSIDEGYFDLTGASKSPVEIALAIRRAIGQRLKITVSEGIGSNKLVSAIASKLNKPAAFAEVGAGLEREFLNPLPNKWLPGVGPALSARLSAAGLARIEQVAATPLEMLGILLGRDALALRQFAHGIDERPLVPAREPQKTFGQQETFAKDLTDEGYIEATLRRMADHLFAKVREEGRSVRTLSVKVRYNDMEEEQVSESLREPTDLETEVYGRIGGMLKRAWRRRVSLRLVALRLSNVYDGRFGGRLVLDAESRRAQCHERLARVVDELRAIRGHSVVLRGHDFRLLAPPVDTTQASVVSSCRRGVAPTTTPRGASTYVPLRARSHYTFLDSTLSPAAIVELAKRHGLPAVALTDIGNLHGAVEFALKAKELGVKPIFGAELNVGGSPLLLFVESAAGYRNLCQLLSLHGREAEGGDLSVAARGRGAFRPGELRGRAEGLVAVGRGGEFAELFPGRFYRMAGPQLDGGDFQTVACPPVHYATREDRWRYDILQSIRTLTLLAEEHPGKRRGGVLHFRTPSEMAAACGGNTGWMRRSLEIAERCTFELPLGKPQFPDFHPPDGSTPREFLRRLVMEGLVRRHGPGAGRHVGQVEEELAIIAAVGYENYFLVVWEMLQECRARGIEWITRGSAADSMVCHCLEISSVCPIRFELYFKRFLNPERMALHKLPDIDIDFPHDRREEVVEIIFARHGAGRCAVVGGFSTFKARAAFAEVAKVLGVSERETQRFTEHFPWGFGGGWVPDERAPSGGARLLELLRANVETRGLPLDEEPYRTAVEMADFLDGVPRHPKMHPCGVVLSRGEMGELTPTFLSNKGLPTTHFDMDAVEAVGLVKIDILAQGGLAVMRDAVRAIEARGIRVDLAALEPWEDPEVWRMISSGGARAVHHIESPAMTSLCRMAKVGEIDGLIAIVSVIRPGAANESKKLAFTRRYQGMEPVEYPDPSLRECLRSTYGLVVYEEHILQISEAFAGLPPGRADVLRRALVKQKRAVVEEIGKEFAASARARGHGEGKIAEVWALVTGFSGYAFNKAHSTAYGVEAYQAAWLKRYFPTEFMAGVLTHGKGFYHPLVYVLECHRLGIRILPPSPNEPGPAFTPRDGAIRVPLTRVKGLTQRTIDALVAERAKGAFLSIEEFHRRVAPAPEEMEAMARAGAFDEFGESRTRQFWLARLLHRSRPDGEDERQLWLAAPTGLERLDSVPLVEPSRLERLGWETDLFGFAASGHPLELFPDVDWDSYCPVAELHRHIGATVVTCGLVVEQRIHHQATGEPMKFLSLADWTGIVETELFAQTYKSHGLATIRYPVLEIEATVEPFENGNGFSLRALRAGKPRSRPR